MSWLHLMQTRATQDFYNASKWRGHLPWPYDPTRNCWLLPRWHPIATLSIHPSVCNRSNVPNNNKLVNQLRKCARQSRQVLAERCNARRTKLMSLVPIALWYVMINMIAMNYQWCSRQIDLGHPDTVLSRIHIFQSCLPTYFNRLSEQRHEEHINARRSDARLSPHSPLKEPQVTSSFWNSTSSIVAHRSWVPRATCRSHRSWECELIILILHILQWSREFKC